MMNYKVKYPIAFATTFLWLGFVGAISFMEAWLKFRAPGITLPLGLGIGRIVFAALNKMEWVFTIAIFINFLVTPEKEIKWYSIFFLIAITILIIQTFWLLPALDARAELHMQNKLVPPSNLHFYYIAFESIKVICLIIFGISLFKK